jgi:hypothetical protein
VAEFSLVIFTVIAVGLGAFSFGRMTMRERIEYSAEREVRLHVRIDELLDELDAAHALADHLMRTPEPHLHPALRVLKGDGA